MRIKISPFNSSEGTVIGWHEDTTKKGNYVLTVETDMGNIKHAIERKLTPNQVEKLKETVPKDSTGL